MQVFLEVIDAEGNLVYCAILGCGENGDVKTTGGRYLPPLTREAEE